MFDQFIDSIKEKIDDLSTSVDAKISESRQELSRSDSDKGLLSIVIGLYDEATDTVAKLLEDKPAITARKPRTIRNHSTAKPVCKISQSSDAHWGSSSSCSRVTDDDDDLYGYGLSSDTDEDDNDSISDLPRIKDQLYSGSYKSSDNKELNLSDIGGQPLPRYALPSSYIKPEEVLKRRVTTTKRITEADLDKNSPLYRHREQILGEDKRKSNLEVSRFLIEFSKNYGG